MTGPRDKSVPSESTSELLHARERRQSRVEPRRRETIENHGSMSLLRVRLLSRSGHNAERSVNRCERDYCLLRERIMYDAARKERRREILCLVIAGFCSKPARRF